MSNETRVVPVEATDAMLRALSAPKFSGPEKMVMDGLRASYKAMLAAAPPSPVDLECVCLGNWRLILKECSHQIGHKFTRNGIEYTFFGLVHGDDDYYYGMWSREEGLKLLTCVGDLDSHEMEYVGPALTHARPQEVPGE